VILNDSGIRKVRFQSAFRRCILSLRQGAFLPSSAECQNDFRDAENGRGKTGGPQQQCVEVIAGFIGNITLRECRGVSEEIHRQSSRIVFDRDGALPASFNPGFRHDGSPRAPGGTSLAIILPCR